MIFVFVRFFGRAASAIFLLSLCAGVVAQSRYPLCPIEPAQQPLLILRPAIVVQVSQEALRASILFPRHELKFEVRTSSTGQLTCISPLDGSFSLFWPFAMKAIENEYAAHPLPVGEQRWLIVLPEPRPLPEKGRIRIIVSRDPYNPPPESLIDPEIEALTCDSHNVDVLLDGVRRSNRSISDPGKFTKELQCANAALALAPGSFAVQYVAGEVDWLVAHYDPLQAKDRAKNKSAALDHYSAAVAFAPDFYEARRDLAFALHDAGETAEAEKLLLRLTEQDNPLSVQQKTEGFLTSFYDKENDRPKALMAARKEEQLTELLDSLEAKNRYVSRNSERAQLAAREEEAGEYKQAANDYLAARNFTDPKMYYSAVFFHYDMGRARSLRASGEVTASAILCEDWEDRINEIGGQLDSGGREVAQAEWEFSCGDFNTAIQELFQTAETRLNHPSDKWLCGGPWNCGTEEIYLNSPFKALESAFLSRRMSELALQTRAIVERYPTYPDQAELDRLKEMTHSLRCEAAKAGVAQGPKP